MGGCSRKTCEPRGIELTKVSKVIGSLLLLLLLLLLLFGMHGLGVQTRFVNTGDRDSSWASN